MLNIYYGNYYECNFGFYDYFHECGESWCTQVIEINLNTDVYFQNHLPVKRPKDCSQQSKSLLEDKTFIEELGESQPRVLR
jgi:hypothetical protein